MTAQDRMDPTEAFAELGRIKLADTDLDGVLGRIAELAKRSLPGAREVSVTLVGGKGARTAAYTGNLALVLDEWQYEGGHGPCLEAAATTATLPISDMTAEDRWSDWTRRAADAGARSSLSVGLPVHEAVTGALNIYSTEPNAFDEPTIVLAQTFAGYAAVALANAHLYDATATLAKHMQAAMDSRAVIEQAKGIVMSQRHCTADEAFRFLTRASQDTNRKLRDVAAELVNGVQTPPGQ
ncbi:MAG TPA: GAF and ANTAR domain-containing protein [Micromonosporaceae bacterium]|nr:GAF and ANTAR domain-containing protein [Micromonosporaceae bacterium]